MYSVLLLGVSTLFIHSSCPCRGVPGLGKVGRAAAPGEAGLSEWSPARLTLLPALARVHYEDEVLRRTVPAARRRPAQGESGLCPSSGGLGPAQGRGKGLLLVSGRRRCRPQ